MKAQIITQFGGINQTDPVYDVGGNDCTDCRNVRIDKGGLKVRPGTVEVGSGLTADVVVRKLISIRDTLFAVQNTSVLKLSSTNWVASGISGISATTKPSMVSFPASSSSDTATGTITNTGNQGQAIEDDTKTWTVNAYVGYYLVITSGQANGQVRRIVANTETEIFLAEPFTIKQFAEVGDTFAVREEVAGTYFFNGETPKLNRDISTTTWSSLSGKPALLGACEYGNRVVGFKSDSNILYFSTLLSGEDFPYEIAIGSNEYPITAIKSYGNQLIVHKGDRGIWVAESNNPEGAYPYDLTFSQRADANGALNNETMDIAENLLFYVSSRGIEWFNPLETDMLEGHKCLSDYRLARFIEDMQAEGDDFSDTYGIAFDAKYFCVFPSSDASRVVIFDNSSYLQRMQEGRQKPYTFLIDSGYEARSFAVHDGELHIGQTGKVVKMSKTASDDDGSAIAAYWEKDGISEKEAVRDLILKRISYLCTDYDSSNDSISTSDITDRTSKTLATVNITEDLRNINGKATRGRKHKIKIDLSNFIGNRAVADARLESVTFYWNKTKIK